MAARNDRLTNAVNNDLQAAEEAFGPPAAWAVSAESTKPVEKPAPPEAVLLATDFKSTQPFNLSIDQSIQIALDHSAVVRTLTSNAVTPLLTTAYDPAIAQANLDAALAAFDASFSSTMYSNRLNQPSGTFFGPGIPEPVRQDEADFAASLVKPLVTGGQASIAYNPPTGYLYLPNGVPAGTINPEIVSNIEMSLRQPLLKGAGLEFNRAPIRIAQLQADQTAWDLKAAVMTSTRSVIQAYWNLQAAYVALQALDETLPLIEEMLRVQEENLAVERVTRVDVAKARAQVHLYRQNQAAAQSTIIQRELQLRNLLGLPPADGRRFVPVAIPSRAPIQSHPAGLMEIAQKNRPDIVRQRLSVRIRETQVVVAKNGLLPQLDVQGLIRTSGLSNNLGDSIDQMFSGSYQDYLASATFSVPLGRRAASANVRGAKSLLEKETALLQQANFGVSHQLGDLMRQIDFTYRQYVEADLRLRDGEEWLQGARLRYQNPPPGNGEQNWLLTALNDYLMALQFRASAMTDAANFLAQYNGLLAQMDEALGTLLISYNIEMVNDPVRMAVQRMPTTRRVPGLAMRPMNYASMRLMTLGQRRNLTVPSVETQPPFSATEPGDTYQLTPNNIPQGPGNPTNIQLGSPETLPLLQQQEPYLLNPGLPPNLPPPNLPSPNLPPPNPPRSNLPLPSFPPPNLAPPSLPMPNLPPPNIQQPNLPQPNLSLPNLPPPNSSLPNLTAPDPSSINQPPSNLPTYLPSPYTPAPATPANPPPMPPAARRPISANQFLN
jgi:outer membrane protein TolC